MDLDQVYRESGPLLRGVGYRICGDVGVAEDLLQETFLRVLETSDPGTIGGHELVSALTRLAVEARQSRQSANYRGTWLPTPVQTDLGGVGDLEPAASQATLGFDFLCALERVAPQPRAAFILAEIAGESPEGIGEILGQPAAIVEASVVEASLVLAESRFHGSLREGLAEKRRLVEAMRAGLASGGLDLPRDGVAPRIEMVFDHGGACNAPENQTCVPGRAVELLSGALQKGPETPRIDIVEVNFLPALLIDLGECPEGDAERFAILPGWANDGLLGRLQIILAPSKLRALSFDGLRPSLGEIF